MCDLLPMNRGHDWLSPKHHPIREYSSTLFPRVELHATFVMWNVIAEKRELRMPRGRLTLGDIILMHYIPSVAPTLELLLRQIKQNGPKPALLLDYLK
jgi:hypothetical protein